MLESAELHFNVDHGYLEGLVRGCKANLLTQQDYVSLAQCETLEGKHCSACHSLGMWRRAVVPGAVLMPRAQAAGLHDLGQEKYLHEQ